MLLSLKEYQKLLFDNDLLIDSSADVDVSIEYVSFNSKDIKTNTLFICKGFAFKEEYLKDAITKGAIAYVSEQRFVNCHVQCLIVSDIRRAMAIIADAFYDHASEKLITVGITGTKGKTTTCYYVRYILDEYLKSIDKNRSAFISSIDTYDGISEARSSNTTPEALDLHKCFSNAVNSGISCIEMEVSSQALKYDRVYGVNFDIGCFLNIDVDHISPVEHMNFEDYFGAKLRLFDQCKISCINTDSKYFDKIKAYASRSPKVITFGTKQEADVYGHDLCISLDSIEFKVRITLNGKVTDEKYKISMPGIFNVENALAAIAICKSLGVDERYIKAGLIKALVPGRMELLKTRDDRIIAIVDYAHNKLSYEAILSFVQREYPDRKVFLLFGCPGGKAFDRRESLAKVVSRYDNTVILTEDDCAQESAAKICDEIASYLTNEYTIVLDRTKAIYYVVDLAKKEEKSVILILGKGRDDYIKRGSVCEEYLSDVDCVKALFEEYKR